MDDYPVKTIAYDYDLEAQLREDWGLDTIPIPDQAEELPDKGCYETRQRRVE